MSATGDPWTGFSFFPQGNTRLSDSSVSISRLQLMNKLIVLLENATPQTSRQGRQYLSFWVKVMMGEEWVSSSGWKYYPDVQIISTPSAMKEGGKFFNTSKTSIGFYN